MTFGSPLTWGRGRLFRLWCRVGVASHHEVLTSEKNREHSIKLQWLVWSVWFMRRLRSISAWLVFFRHQERGSLMKWSPPHPARAKGLAIMKRLAVVLAEHELPVRLTVLLQRLHNHLIYLDEQIKAMDKELACQVADDDLGSRLLRARSPLAC